MVPSAPVRAGGRRAGLSRTERLTADLAEIVLGSSSRNEFRRVALETITRSLSLDGAVLHHTWDGHYIYVNTEGLDQRELRPSLSSYLDEMSTAEISILLRKRFVRDDIAFCQRRRDSLRAYTEYLRPRFTWGFAVRGWFSRWGLFWLTVTREGRRAHYRDAELGILDDVFPLLMTGDAMFAEENADAEPPDASLRTTNALVTFLSSHSRWLRRPSAPARVTAATPPIAAYPRDLAAAPLPPRTRDTLALLLEGLSDKAIAMRLGISPYTVNQYTKTIYRRFGVSSRSTLIARWLGRR
jgi:DNA-binding CsgD family transcriptional regulator